MNGNDDEIDELDDEVAMISNKKIKDEISPDDIRIEFKSEPVRNQSKEKSVGRTNPNRGGTKESN
jgi:ABC-type multidrug transport system ATPase subunit